MRKIVVFSLVAAAAFCSSGCDGVVKTWEDRKLTYKQVNDMDMRQIADDWDKIWLADRQYRLTRYNIR